MAKQMKVVDGQSELSDEFAQYKKDAQAFFTVDSRLAKAMDRLTKARAALSAAQDEVESIRGEKDELGVKLGFASATAKPSSNGASSGGGKVREQVEAWFAENATTWAKFPTDDQKAIASYQTVQKHVAALVEAGTIEKKGNARSTEYKWVG